MKNHLLLLSASLATAQVQADNRPNIILFMVDDMGWQDTSVPFWTERTPLNNTYETPNMERLAREGMVFTQAYAAAISSPSRCSLYSADKVENPVERAYGCRSFVDILHDSGYYTIHCGKAHWGAMDTPGELPEHFGFDVNIAGHAAGGLATYLSERNYGHDSQGRALTPMATPGLEKYWGTGTFLTDALTQEALHVLDEWKSGKSDAPFYLYMSHYAVHIPIDRDPRFFQKYRRHLHERQRRLRQRQPLARRTALHAKRAAALGQGLAARRRHPRTNAGALAWPRQTAFALRQIRDD